MSRWAVHPSASHSVGRLTSDLRAVFGGRLRSVVTYGPWVVATTSTARPGDEAPVNALALVDDLTFSDLSACAERAASWGALRLAMPLLLSREEFVSSLDAFPLEFGDILSRHVTCDGTDPFEGVRVRDEDLRRACEVQAKSHLIHLREGFLEAGGEAGAVDRLIRESRQSFSALLSSLARLEQQPSETAHDLAQYAGSRLGVSAPLVERVLGLADRRPSDEALQLYSPYHDAAAAIAAHVDRWKAPARA